VYYRYVWSVQDMAAYAEQVFFAQDAGKTTRRAALQGFVGMFEPGKLSTSPWLASDCSPRQASIGCACRVWGV
jgi:hypothetical protein